ncbi:FemAB family protein [Novipirellula aureliae]|uniref:FemAB family protein n=1 Tax=Novipirellula aureliae TaxID=2527966 RepID=A0A5C6DG96_9BACT|nr:GNAT family N-acetyltransferase [Novipirellula aureliae]TWU35820.1 FemAB family protein [Novipirellula aureliae]
MSHIGIQSFDQTEDWDAFVAAHPKGSIFHTAAMCRTMQATKGYEVLAIAACVGDGDVQAILVAIRISTIRSLGRLAARSIMFAEPICSDDEIGEKCLNRLLEHHDRCVAQRTLFSEVRPVFHCGPNRYERDECVSETSAFRQGEREHAVMISRGYERLGYNNYVVDLTRPENELWNNINAKCRRDILRSERRGVTLRDGNLIDDLGVLYGHLQQSHSRSHVPLVDRSLFVAAARELPTKQVSLCIAEYQGAPIASVCNLIFKGRVFCWYAGIIRTPGIAANSMLNWDAIRRGAADGHSILDFAGAGWKGEAYGPGKFKSRFGGRLVEYGRYRRIHSKPAMKAAETVYRYARRLLDLHTGEKIRIPKHSISGSSEHPPIVAKEDWKQSHKNTGGEYAI